MLRHPLLPQRPYDERFAALYNRELQIKQADLEAAKASHNWPKVIWLHERPFRATALQSIANEMPDSQFWAMVAEVWLDADNTYDERSRWTTIWTSPRGHRDHVMTVDEHKALDKIPDDEITIYRGCGTTTINGMSWSLNPDDARNVAHRVARLSPVVVVATVPKRRIQAFFSGRPSRLEDEVVVLPNHFRLVSARPLPRRRARIMQAAE
jgi:hypothetical protein